MNKKGFTLTELLIVLVLLGIIIGIVVPNTTKILNYSKIKEAEALEKVIVDNLKLYNESNEQEIWCPLSSSDESTCLTEGDKYVSFDDLKSVNSSVNLGSCILKDNKSLKITKDHDGDYIYSAHIICSNDFADRDSIIASSSDLNNKHIYYETEK